MNFVQQIILALVGGVLTLEAAFAGPSVRDLCGKVRPLKQPSTLSEFKEMLTFYQNRFGNVEEASEEIKKILSSVELYQLTTYLLTDLISIPGLYTGLQSFSQKLNQHFTFSESEFSNPTAKALQEVAAQFTTAESRKADPVGYYHALNRILSTTPEGKMLVELSSTGGQYRILSEPYIVLVENIEFIETADYWLKAYSVVWPAEIKPAPQKNREKKKQGKQEERVLTQAQQEAEQTRAIMRKVLFKPEQEGKPQELKEDAVMFGVTLVGEKAQIPQIPFPLYYRYLWLSTRTDIVSAALEYSRALRKFWSTSLRLNEEVQLSRSQYVEDRRKAASKIHTEMAMEYLQKKIPPPELISQPSVEFVDALMNRTKEVSQKAAQRSAYELFKNLAQAAPLAVCERTTLWGWQLVSLKDIYAEIEANLELK